MREPVTASLLLELLPRLQLAFPSNRVSADRVALLADVYCDGLATQSADAVRHAVKAAIEQDTYFPKVARLRELAHEFDRRTNAVIPARHDADLWCPQCRTTAEWVERYVPRFDDARRLLVDDTGQWVYLGTLARLACRCTSPSLYVPEPDMEPPVMARSRITWLAGAQPWGGRYAQLARTPVPVARGSA